jgi:hypothetical protein
LICPKIKEDEADRSNITKGKVSADELRKINIFATIDHCRFHGIFLEFLLIWCNEYAFLMKNLKKRINVILAYQQQQKLHGNHP